MALPRIPTPLPYAGFAVPVDRIDYRTFLLGFVPVHSHNSLSPELVLFPGHMAIKSIRMSQYEYTALREVRYRPEQFLSRSKIELRFQDGARYTLTLASPAVERDFLQFLQAGGAPLTPAALQHLA
ncbi:hypothetical protein EJV47_02305 [Hymenobacter gummosus]|uniref:Uncharacterized protein n=1 Tax=Hymenobacter gummosus TaxID=1776032 RepID=A0A431U8P5_9BACT|nr:hypothetical protein [Hymenobacter gummosus]RTQ53591.1 hypothetical protein EJV47_02305 [Hymenobacter gummosus]